MRQAGLLLRRRRMLGDCDMSVPDGADSRIRAQFRPVSRRPAARYAT
jgi:hypothetical protein